MKTENVKIVEELKKLGIYELYHANAVITSLTFIENKGLMPKGLVNDNKLLRADQDTDYNDKKFNIYYDIFFDTTDIHLETKSVNDYGPVLFVFNVDMLAKLDNSEVKVTRINPIYWHNNMNDEEKYLNCDEIAEHMKKGDFNNQVTIRNFNDILNFDYLKEIIIDDPGIENELLLKNAMIELKARMELENISVPLQIRNCKNCECKEKYTNMRYAYHHFKTRL